MLFSLCWLMIFRKIIQFDLIRTVKTTTKSIKQQQATNMLFQVRLSTGGLALVDIFIRMCDGVSAADVAVTINHRARLSPCH